jgi:hypothetical protein
MRGAGERGNCVLGGQGAAWVAQCCCSCANSSVTRAHAPPLSPRLPSTNQQSTVHQRVLMPSHPPTHTHPHRPTCMQLPDCASHIQRVKSSLPASTTSPLGCQHSHSTPSPGPSSVCTQPPSDTRHTRTVESRLAVANRLPGDSTQQQQQQKRKQYMWAMVA